MANALHVRWVRWTALVLFVPQAALDVVVWQHPRALWPQANGLNAALESLGAPGRAYERLLPSIQTDGVTLSAAALVIVMILVVAAVVKFGPRNGEVTQWPIETRA